VLLLNVGLDDVGAGLQVGAVDALDHRRLREDEDLGAVLEEVRMVREAVAAVVRLFGLVGVDHRAHRAVQDHDPLGQDRVEGASCRCVGGGGHGGPVLSGTREEAAGGRAVRRLGARSRLEVPDYPSPLAGLSRRAAAG